MAQPSAKPPTANVFQTSDTKLASCLVALGFPFQHRLRHRQSDGKDYIDFMFGVRSLRPQFTHFTITVAKLWKKGALPPMHPLCVMMRALINREALLDMQKGVPMRLVSVAEGCMTEFRHGAENPQILAMRREFTEPDLDLMASVSGVGIPPLTITGTHPAHVFHLSRHGFTLKDPVTKAPVMHDAQRLLRRAPTVADPLHLALEDEEPLHPVVLGYDVLTVRAELQRMIRSTQPSLIVEEAGMTAELSLNYTGRVMERIAHRFGTVPV